MPLIIVSGAIANKMNQGGEAWVRLSYLLGLQELGYEVHFIEQISQKACVDRTGQPSAFESSANKAYFDLVMQTFGLQRASTLILVDKLGQAVFEPELLSQCARASALLNISGHLNLQPLLEVVRCKAFIDIDPGYTQYWHVSELAGAQLSGHDFYFTIGENIGTPECRIPTCGINWLPTRPPVVLSHWPVLDAPSKLKFTTVANWRGAYGAVQFGDETFGLKVHEFRKMIDLPRRAPGDFEIALNIHPGDEKDRHALLAHHWQLVDPVAASDTPENFQHYVQQSSAEFSVAQGIYVDTHCGWFSDRTVRYLASGRPALVQETGFSKNLPTGMGLVPFTTLQEAVDGAQAIAADYAAHSRAARRIAEAHFDSDKVLQLLMERIGVTPL